MCCQTVFTVYIFWDESSTMIRKIWFVPFCQLLVIWWHSKEHYSHSPLFGIRIIMEIPSNSILGIGSRGAHCHTCPRCPYFETRLPKMLFVFGGPVNSTKVILPQPLSITSLNPVVHLSRIVLWSCVSSLLHSMPFNRMHVRINWQFHLQTNAVSSRYLCNSFQKYHNLIFFPAIDGLYVLPQN